MKNSLLNLLMTIVVTVVLIEGIQIGFHLMTMSDTIFFYIGLTLVVVLMFSVGAFIGKEMFKLVSKFKKNDEVEK